MTQEKKAVFILAQVLNWITQVMFYKKNNDKEIKLIAFIRFAVTIKKGNYSALSKKSVGHLIALLQKLV